MVSVQESGALLRPIPSDVLSASRRSQPASNCVHPRRTRTETPDEPLVRHDTGASLMHPMERFPLMRETSGMSSGESSTSAARAAGTPVQEPRSDGRLPDPMEGLEELVPELLTEEDDEWMDDVQADAVPTSAMPVPVSVPLYDLSTPERPRGIGRWITLGFIVVLGAAFVLCWKMGLLPWL